MQVIITTLIIMAFLLDQDCAGSVAPTVRDHQAVSSVHCQASYLGHHNKHRLVFFSLLPQ